MWFVVMEVAVFFKRFGALPAAPSGNAGEAIFCNNGRTKSCNVRSGKECKAWRMLRTATMLATVPQFVTWWKALYFSQINMLLHFFYHKMYHKKISVHSFTTLFFSSLHLCTLALPPAVLTWLCQHCCGANFAQSKQHLCLPMFFFMNNINNNNNCNINYIIYNMSRTISMTTQQ